MPKRLPEKFKAGSLNVLAIASLNESIKLINRTEIDVIFKKEKDLLYKLRQSLSQFRNIKMIGENQGIEIVSCVFETYSPDEIGEILNQREVFVRTGLHCSPVAHKFLGTFPAGTVRFSLGYFNT